MNHENKNNSLSDDIQNATKVGNTAKNIRDIAKVGAKAAAGNYVGAAADAIKNSAVQKTIKYIALGLAIFFIVCSMFFLMIPTLMFGSVDETGNIVMASDGEVEDYEGKFAIKQMSYFIEATSKMAAITEETFNTRIQEAEEEIEADFTTRKHQYTAPADVVTYRLQVNKPTVSPEYYYYIPSMYCVRQENDASSLMEGGVAHNPEEKLTEEETENLSNIGNFKLTFYCACSICCGDYANGITASGTTATEGRTIAVDKNKIPLGTKVYIEGFGWFVAEDTGGAIKGNRIDVFMSSHQAALNAGVKYADVYIDSSIAAEVPETSFFDKVSSLIGAAWDTVTNYWSNLVNSIIGTIFPDYEANIRNDKYLYELEYFMQLIKARNYAVDSQISIEEEEQIVTWQFIDAHIGPITTHTRTKSDGSKETYTKCTITLIYNIDLKSLDYIATNLYHLNRGREEVDGYTLDFRTYQTERAMQMGKNVMALVGVTGSGGGNGAVQMSPEEISRILNELNLSVTDESRRAIIAAAVTLIGKTTYNLGSKASADIDYPSQLDCSGFVTWAYGRAGISFVHGSSNQYYNSRVISASELKPGDLGLLTNPVNIATGSYNHIGIYVGTDSSGNRIFIHCSGGHNGVYMEAYPNFKVFVRPNVL